MNPEWLHFGLTVIVALLGAYQVWQNTNIKLAISQQETKIEQRLSAIREWARDTFVSKTQQMDLLSLVANEQRKKS